ncbi:MAG: 1-phosphofructokinase [Ancalomicrobiaceae bacterium]|nr:1-phosphofructokinase [Ancalomicrobiaceae bacterium]
MTAAVHLTDAVTVTLNPAIDLTVTVDRFTLGRVQRARALQSCVGGKGVNVAGCLADWGLKVDATGILGRANDRVFVDFFAEKGIADRFIRTSGETRTNFKIADTVSGDVTEVNLPGLEVSQSTFETMRATLRRAVVPGRPIVLAGSLAEGLPVTTWVDLIADITERGGRVVLDTSGSALAATLGGPHVPHVIKPNRVELEGVVGRPLPETADVIAVARHLVKRGVGLVVVSRGSKGAVLVDKDQAIEVVLPAKTVLSNVGTGDAMVAGLVAGMIEGAPLERLARLAVAFASAKLDQIGPHIGTVAEVEALAAAAKVTIPG